MKKTLSILLSLIMIISITAGLDFLTLADTTGDYEYTLLDDGTAEITKYKGDGGDVSIPSIIDGYIVTSIGDSAFYYRNSLTSVSMPNSITSIGHRTFISCKNLENIVFSNKLKSIGYAAFSHCDKLSNINFQNGIERIGYEAFFACENLSTVVIPITVTEIGGSAFQGANIKDVFYFGGKEEWNQINIVTGNDVLLNANIRFNASYCDVNGHNFGNNDEKCLVCGVANPNYIATQPTIPASAPAVDTLTQPATATPTAPKEKAPAGATKVNGEWVAKKQKNAKIKKLTKAKKSFKVSWSKVTGVTGYQIQYSTSSKFTKKTTKTVTIKKNKTTSTTVKKLKAKKKYYVRIRTYKNVKLNGKTVKVYSSWTKAKGVKTK